LSHSHFASGILQLILHLSAPMKRAFLFLLLLGLPQTATAQLGVPRFGVPIPMRDGVRLVADIWLPDSVGTFPAILLRTPYLKTPQFKRYKLAAYLQRGYAVVLQDTRGRGDSEGEFDFYFPEGKDGYDTIEWIARQSWSNGRVAMDGGSYLGTVQWLAARERPPALRCIAPTAPSGRIFDEIPYLGGAFRMEWAVPWLNLVSGRAPQGDLAELVNWQRIMRHRPLATMDLAFGRSMRLYREFLAHATFDEYWRRIQLGPEDFSKIDIPVLTVTGWFDGDQPGALHYWDGMERHGPRPETRALIIGPWTHAQTYLGGEPKVNAWEPGPGSILDIQGIRLAFFDACLKGAPPVPGPRVRVFVTGANRWIESDRYPLADVERRALYLHSGGAANSAEGDGRLSWDAPGQEPPDSFTYDPRNPVPSRGITLDHQGIHRRRDLLVYTSDSLTAPLEIVGRVFVKLLAASDAVDTDFTAKLFDVHPDGRALVLGPSEVGVKRARYRQGYERTALLTPGKAEEYAIELFDIGHRFLPGHRIRVEISSSASPYIAPNQNTGLPVATDTTWRVARQTIFHDRTRPSRVELPVLPIR
jgi:putative CocE/NonD family hydrolase